MSIISMACIHYSVQAQSLEPFSPYGIFSPSVEAWQMTRYGNLTPSLYTGGMTFSLPLYTYSDPDFTIPISLEYSFDGYRPAQHSGTVGYGWYLNCGGVITREVRGIPDEGDLDGGSGYECLVRGWRETPAPIRSSMVNKLNKVYSARRRQLAYIPEALAQGVLSSYNTFSDTPALTDANDTTGATVVYDPAPDIYRFRFLGHGGEFMMLPDGTVRVYNSDLPYGELSVSFADGISQNPSYVEITLTTGDGYTCLFAANGGNISPNQQSTNPFSVSRSVNEYSLVSITAPNGRTVTFAGEANDALSISRSYGTEGDVQYSIVTDHDNGDGGNSTGTAYINNTVPWTMVQERGSRPSAITVSGSGSSSPAAQILFNYSRITSEYSSSGYSRTELLTLYGDMNAYRLQDITVLNKDRDTTERITFSQHTHSSGTPKLFLDSVSSLRGGTHQFTYNINGFVLPKNDTEGTDHWGFWNGASISDLRDHLTEFSETEAIPAHDEYITDIDSTWVVHIPATMAKGHSTHLYDQTVGSAKEAVFLYSECGALTQITYPTGGTTSIEYEPNTVRRRLNHHEGSTAITLEPADSSNANATWTVGGVRVKSLIDSDGTGAQRRTAFSYTDSQNRASGILMQMPRYCQRAQYIHKVNSTFTGSGVRGVAIATLTSFSGALFPLSCDAHVAYPSVTVTHPDGSRTEHRFSSVEDSNMMDLRAAGSALTKRTACNHDWIEPMDGIAMHIATDMIPVSTDRRAMRGKPLSENTFDAAGNLIHGVSYTYGYEQITIPELLYNNTTCYNLSSYAVQSPLLIRREESLHGMASTQIFTYNTKGQTETVTTERFCEAAGAGLYLSLETERTYYRFLHEGYGDSWFAANAALRSAKDAAVRTAIAADGSERVTAAESYSYSAGNPRPTGIVRYSQDTPSTLAVTGNRSAAFSAGLTGKTQTTSVSYDAHFHPITLLYSPGGAAIYYVWNGNRLASRTDNVPGNTTSFSWKDLVGPTLITAPSGIQTAYGYDSSSRLKTIYAKRDADTLAVRSYDYKLQLEDQENSIRTTTFTSDDGSSYYRDVTYFDGLGYGVQNLQIAGSPLGHTVSTQTVWDSMHRPDTVSYLPYVRSDGSAGFLDAGHAIDDMLYWYSYNTNGYSDSRPYAVKAYETSSYGRPTHMQREGDEWNAGGGHGTHLCYGFNAEEDSLMRFAYVPAVASGAGAHPAQAACTGLWDGALLAMTRSIDEAGAVTDTYTDVRGRTICTRGWSGPAATNGGPGTGTLSETYYVYDLRDSLVLAVQPEGAAALRALPAASRTITIQDNASNANNSIYREYCFGCTYDAWGNLVAEHVPGGGTTERVFDARGRLVLETNDLMSAVDASVFATSQPRYVQTTYDACNRVVQRRVIRTSTALSALRAACDTSANVPSATEAGFTQICQLYAAEYFPFSGVTGVLTGFVADAGVVSSADVDTANVRGLLRSEVLYPAASADGTAPTGGIIRTKNYYYDYRGRVVQVAECDSDGWTARYSTRYDFVGNVLATKETHTGTDDSSTKLLTTNYYDSRGRITTSNRELDGVPLRSLTYEYDELGRLARKTYGDGPDNIGYAAFDYDIHGWTTGIEARNNWGQDVVFGETLRYASPTKPGSMARYDGNISEISFNTDTYAYTYDGLKRLTDAVHYTGSATTPDNVKTERWMAYDRNGNMTGITRYDASGVGSTHSFSHTGNRLAGSNYGYDVLGNMTQDAQKGLQFSYNLANLPCKVEGMAGSANAGLTLSYGYLADGTKTSSVTNQGEGLKYRGSFVYEIGGTTEQLSSIAWSEGRVALEYGIGGTIPEIRDEWHICDHLGNTRVVVDMTDWGTVLEQNEYLPFGTRIANPSSELTTNRYRLAGKEEQRFGIGAGTLDLHLSDFGARFYDPFTARWTTRDPLAGKYHSLSPYNYCNNDPINKFDPNGNAANFVVGAAVGFASEFVIQVATNIAKGDNFYQAVNNIDGKSVLISTLAGAAGVGIVSKVKQAGKALSLGKTAMAVIETGTEAIVSGTESAAKQLASDGSVSIKETAVDSAIGALASGFGQSTKNAKQGSQQVSVLRRQLDRAERVARGSSDSSPKKMKANQLKQQLESYGDTSAQAVNSITDFTISIGFETYEDKRNH